MEPNDVFNMIVELRGGVPERCDFCGERYTDSRRPTPDEGGEWACTVCWERWEKQDKEKKAMEHTSDALEIARKGTFHHQECVSLVVLTGGGRPKCDCSFEEDALRLAHAIDSAIREAVEEERLAGEAAMLEMVKLRRVEAAEAMREMCARRLKRAADKYRDAGFESISDAIIEETLAIRAWRAAKEADRG